MVVWRIAGGGLMIVGQALVLWVGRMGALYYENMSAMSQQRTWIAMTAGLCAIVLGALLTFGRRASLWTLAVGLPALAAFALWIIRR